MRHVPVGRWRASEGLACPARPAWPPNTTRHAMHRAREKRSGWHFLLSTSADGSGRHNPSRYVRWRDIDAATRSRYIATVRGAFGRTQCTANAPDVPRQRAAGPDVPRQRAAGPVENAVSAAGAGWRPPPTLCALTVSVPGSTAAARLAIATLSPASFGSSTHLSPQSLGIGRTDYLQLSGSLEEEISGSSVSWFGRFGI